MQIKVLGHSSLYIEFRGCKILVDPCLQTELMGIFRRFPDIGEIDFQLPSPDMIILTHHHWDVVCIKTLMNLDKNIRVLIPNNQQLILILRQLEFRNVEVLSDWQEIDVSNGSLTVVPSDVSFGEMGFVLSDRESTFLNLSDCKINMHIVNQIKAKFSHIDLCLAPFQSYDEMAVLMRRDSKLSHRFLIEQVQFISQLSPKVVLPFKDGLYYPFSDLLNKKSFLYSPFQFIDVLKEYNSKIQSELLIGLDEVTLLDGKVNIDRENHFTTEELGDLFNEYRLFNEEQKYVQFECEREYRLIDLENIQGFLLEDFYRHLSPRMKKQCRLEGVVFSIDIVNCLVGYEIDFSTAEVKLKSSNELSTMCTFAIQLEDLEDLVYGRQLLSILMQTDRICVTGINDQMSYRALDIMFGAGFGDRLRLNSYIEHLHSNAIITYAEISDSGCI